MRKRRSKDPLLGRKRFFLAKTTRGWKTVEAKSKKEAKKFIESYFCEGKDIIWIKIPSAEEIVWMKSCNWYIPKYISKLG